MRIWKGKKPTGYEGRHDIWEEEFRLKSITDKKRTLIKKLTKGRELIE